jgi:hypothetical protein
MRLTRESLIKIARDAAAQRVKISRRLVCIYLTGSVLGDDPLLGGTTDIDLVFVHDSEPAREREVIRLSDDVHLDIAHYDQALFQHPRHLRADPWMGPFIYSKPLVLHDTQHWFDFIQAATGAQFYQPDYSYQRARALYQSARDSWMKLTLDSIETHAAQVKVYLQALEDAGNSLVCLSGPPLTERRFFIHFGQRAQSLHHPEVSTRLMGMVMAPSTPLDSERDTWMAGWKATYLAAAHQEEAPARLHAGRLPYYERAAAALWEPHPVAALWILLRTWTLAAAQLAPGAPQLDAWQSACQMLGLGVEQMEERVLALDQYLDVVDEALSDWGHKNGVAILE